MKNVNYGNRLQAMALSNYLKKYFPDAEVDSICFNDWGEQKVTNVFFWSRLKLKHLLMRLRKRNDDVVNVTKRLDKFNTFSNKFMTIIDSSENLHSIVATKNYDYLIVGSDIVWGQERGYVNKSLFLDFKLHNNVKRVAYAASFGAKNIPNENKDYISNVLTDFSGISVRESSAVGLLSSIGVEDVYHVADPTLLITKQEWEQVEKIDIEVRKRVPEKYIFTYILGKDNFTRTEVERLAKDVDLPIVTIQYAGGTSCPADDNYNAIKLSDVSPEEWIWLINHAEYVITDSFHGSVFSTIFKKKFLVTKREYIVDINERMRDFLMCTNQIEKWQSLNSISSLAEFDFHFKDVDHKLTSLIKDSSRFIENIIVEDMKNI